MVGPILVITPCLTWAFSRQLCVSFGAQVKVYFESYAQRSRYTFSQSRFGYTTSGFVTASSPQALVVEATSAPKPAADILAGRESDAFRELMRFQAGRAKEHYAQAMAALPPADRRAQRPGLIMAAIYRTLLEEIERDGFRVLKQRTSLTPLRKLFIAWKTWLAA